MSFGQEELPRSTSRSRQPSSKMKVLVRSHAVQEETSPPRQFSRTHFVPPDISVTSYRENITESFLLESKHKNVHDLSKDPAEVSVLTPSCVSTSTVVSSAPLRCLSSNTSHCASLENKNNSSNVNCLSSLFSQNLKLKETASCATYNNEILPDSSNKSCKSCSKEQEENIISSNKTLQKSKDLTANRSTSKHKLKLQSTSQSSLEETLSVSPCLSQDGGLEQYTDTSGADLNLFIPETLNKNFKDRTFMLRIEQELINLAKDEVKTHYKFPPMSSYQRMLVHRCAAYFGMDHNIESSGKCVVVNKTKTTRIPEIEFNAHIKRDIVFSEEPTRSILKRDSNSTEECRFTSPDRQDNLESRRSRSFEEREEEYAKIRRRIFDKKELCLLHQMQTNVFPDSLEWSGTSWDSSSRDNLCKFKLQPPEVTTKSVAKLVKTASEEIKETARPNVAKSLSFGGYRRSFNRGDSMQSTLSAGSGYLTKQDSTASSTSWRLSPTSSGYRSQSYISESITPSPTSTPNPSSDPSNSAPILWAVTDMHLVPKGSVIIDPQNGEPFKNEDGSIYHYDPDNFSSEFFNVSQSSYLKRMSLETKSDCKSPISQSSDYPSKQHPRVTSSSSNSGLPYSSRNPLQQYKRNDQFLPEMNEHTPNAAEAHYSSNRQEEMKEHTFFYSQKCSNYARLHGIPSSGPRIVRSQTIGDMDSGYYVNNSIDSTTQSTSCSPGIARSMPAPYQSSSSLYYHHPYSVTPFQKHQDLNPLPTCLQSPIISPNVPNYLVQNYSVPSPSMPSLPYILNPDLVPVFLQHSCSHPYQSHPLIYPNYHNTLLPQNIMYSNSMYSSLGPQYNTLPPYIFTSFFLLIQFTIFSEVKIYIFKNKLTKLKKNKLQTLNVILH